MDCSLPDSSVHGILQARELEWGAVAFSGGSSEEAPLFILPGIAQVLLPFQVHQPKVEKDEGCQTGFCPMALKEVLLLFSHSAVFDSL